LLSKKNIFPDVVLAISECILDTERHFETRILNARLDLPVMVSAYADDVCELLLSESEALSDFL
jgi:hypothetical protein